VFLKVFLFCFDRIVTTLGVGFTVLRIFIMAMGDVVEQYEKKSDAVVPWWTEGGLTVWRAFWYNSDFKEQEDFCDVLKSSLSARLRFFGFRIVQPASGAVLYGVILGLPCRLRSWNGLREKLRLKRKDGHEDVACVGSVFPDDVCSGFVLMSPRSAVSEFVKDTQELICTDGGEGQLFGEVFKVQTLQHKEEVLPLFDDVDQMLDAWKND